MFVDSPPDQPTSSVPDCSTSVGAPVVDTVFAAAIDFPFMLAGLLAAANSYGSSKNTAAEIGAGFGVLTLTQAISAGYGYSKTAKCREMRRTAERRQDVAQLRREMMLTADPAAGTEGHACVASSNGGLCQAGLLCLQGRCGRVEQRIDNARRQQDLRDFIVGSHEKLVADIAAGQGDALDELIKKLGVKDEQREQTVKWLAQVAVDKADALEFANAVVEWAIPNH